MRWSSTGLRALARRFTALSETEARCYTDVSALVRLIPERISNEQQRLASAWAGVGFGVGWPLPERVIDWAIARGLEPDRHSAIVGMLDTLYGLDAAARFDYLLQTGARTIAGAAFRTTSVLDNFNRTDAATLGANWTPSQFGGSISPRIVGNAAGPDSDLDAGNYADAFWNVATFGPDVECYMTLSANAGGGGYECHIRLTGLDGTPDGYMISGQDGGGNDNQLYRINQNVQTALGSAAVQDMSNGDKVGVERIGNDLKMYRMPAAGSWAQLGSTVTDSNLSQAAGNIGLNIQRRLSAHRVDDFGGGTVVAGGGAHAARRLMGMQDYSGYGPIGVRRW